MQIGSFRRGVVKTLTPKATKMALRTVSRNSARTQIAQATVGLSYSTGQLLQTNGQYLLGLPQTQEQKDDSFAVLGTIGYHLTALARALKVKLPSSTKKSKLVGTRGAGILQLDSLSTDLLFHVHQGMFASPKMTTVVKMVSMPQKGGAKEQRNVEVVDVEAEAAVEVERQTVLKSFLSAAVDQYWRLCFDMTGQPPAAVLQAKYDRLKIEHPSVVFDDAPKPKAVAKKVPPKKAKKTAEPVPA